MHVFPFFFLVDTKCGSKDLCVFMGSAVAESLKCVLTVEEQKSFFILGVDKKEEKKWKPLCTYLDGTRWHILFQNRDTKSYKFMWVHIMSDPDGQPIYEISSLDETEARKKYDWIMKCVSP